MQFIRSVGALWSNETENIKKNFKKNNTEKNTISSGLLVWNNISKCAKKYKMLNKCTDMHHQIS